MAGREHGKLGFEPLIPVHWSEQGTGPHTSGRLPSPRAGTLNACPAPTPFQGGNLKTIPLTQGRIAIVDGIDFESLSRYKWCLQSNPQKTSCCYAKSVIDGRLVTMHRFLLGCHGIVDHINGDGLDNRRCNLRSATVEQNACNRGPIRTREFKGVYWCGPKKKWRARVKLSGRSYHLGYFESREEAYQSYCQFAQDLHGEFFHP
jgi:hypothetical protein